MHGKKELLQLWADFFSSSVQNHVKVSKSIETRDYDRNDYGLKTRSYYEKSQTHQHVSTLACAFLTRLHEFRRLLAVHIVAVFTPQNNNTYRPARGLKDAQRSPRQAKWRPGLRLSFFPRFAFVML